MNAHPLRSKLPHQLVIFIITWAVLWTQFFGLNHAINHSWSANYAASPLSQKNSQDRVAKADTFFEVSDQGQSNSSITHNCFALDSCSLSIAVFFLNQEQFTNSLISFSNVSKLLTRLSSKPIPFFLSRAPPKLLAR